MERKQYRAMLYAELGPDDPVVRWLRRRVLNGRLVLCPRCLSHHMRAGADLCTVCAEQQHELELAKKRRHWHGRDGAAGSPTVRRETATCEHCGAAFERDVPARGQPVRLCSEACRRASAREHKQQKAGRSLAELEDRHARGGG